MGPQRIPGSVDNKSQHRKGLLGLIVDGENSLKAIATAVLGRDAPQSMVCAFG